jgi:hypothetical protein
VALQSSGTISLNDIHIEAGGSSGTLCSINDSDIRGLIGKSSGAASSFSNFYGASAVSVSVSRSSWYNTGSGTSSSKWTGYSQNKSHNSQANIYFNVSGGTATFNVNAVISSERNYDFGYVYNGGSQLWRQSGSGYSYNNSSLSIGAGSYLRLRYTKDYSVSSYGDDLTHTVYWS